MIRLKKAIALIITVLTICGCGDMDGQPDGKIKEYTEPKVEREWTILVYMGADNELDGAALEDINEMESADYMDGVISVLVLIDRMDASSGNWSGTRLYEIKTDVNGKNSGIISVRLDGRPEVNITTDGESELDTGSAGVLSGVINYAKRAYPAAKYGLIVWGHGLGWKGCVTDDTAGTSMTLGAFKTAVADKGLEVIAFDTDFGATLESAYEIRNCALFMAGSPGIGSDAEKGWDYLRLFTIFLGKRYLTAESFCESVMEQYEQEYERNGGYGISVVNLSKAGEIFSEFESFSGGLAATVNSVAEKNKLYGSLLDGTVTTYYRNNGGYPVDVYADIYSLSLLGNGGALRSTLNSAVKSWSAGYGNTRTLLGVFVNTLAGGGVYSPSHAAGYEKGTGTIEFVRYSENWVPSGKAEGMSLLDKIFYREY